MSLGMFLNAMEKTSRRKLKERRELDGDEQDRDGSVKRQTDREKEKDRGRR